MIHLDGTTFEEDLSVKAQAALVDYVMNKCGGCVHSEYDAFQHDEAGRMQGVRDLIILQRQGGRIDTISYSVVQMETSHPVLTIPVPLLTSFSLYMGGSVGAPRDFATNPVKVLMDSTVGGTPAGPGVAVREILSPGSGGRIVGMSHTGNFATTSVILQNQNPLQDPNFLQLYVNAVT